VLVLTRRSDESIMIGDDVEISVLSIRGEKVRLGISAPRELAVFRLEIYRRIAAARGDDPPGDAPPGGAEGTPAPAPPGG
jgi:carbon storage regulator